MSTLPKDTLYYLPDSHVFIFKSDNLNALKIHRVGTKRLNSHGQVYTLPAHYPAAMTSLADFKAIFPDGKASKDAATHISALKKTPESLNELTTLNNLDYKFKFPPYLHQSRSIEFMLNYRRLLLALDMGLGKTFISLHYLDITKQKAVVFGPTIVLDTWFNQTLQFTKLKPVIYRGSFTKPKREKLRNRITSGDLSDWDLIITNYEAVVPRKNKHEDYDFFRSLGHTCTIIDEASRLLGHKSLRAQAVEAVANEAENIYLLSGTISKGKPTDVYTPFRIMDSEILGSNYWRFRNKYCTFSPYNRNIITGYKNLDELKALIDPFMLCMQRDECLDMPERTFIEEHYKMSQEQLVVYEAVKNLDEVHLPLKGNGKLTPEFDNYSPDTHGTVRCKLAIVKLNKLQQILSGFITLSPERDYRKCNECPHLLECMDEAEFEVFPWDPKCKQYDENNPTKKPESRVLYFKENPKLNLLYELLQEIGVEELGTKCIIWAQYRRDLELIQTLLSSKGIAFITPDQNDCEKEFQTNPDIPVFVGQVNKGIGITLTAAKVMINYSYSLELEHRSQSLDRNYRIGQNSKVVVKDILHPRSVESGIFNMLSKKEDVKAFMQKSNSCKDCNKNIDCLELGIRPYSEGCRFYGLRKEAEKKEAIKIV